MGFRRCSSLNFYLYYKMSTSFASYAKTINAIGYGHIDTEGGITIDDNDNITIDSDFLYNYCNLIGDNGEEGAYKCINASDIANKVLEDSCDNVKQLQFNGSFTLLEKL